MGFQRPEPNLTALRRAVDESPGNLGLLLLYAHALADELSFDEAEAVFEQILKADPKHREAQLGVAEMLLFKGRTSEAVVRAESLVIGQQPYAAAHLFLSRAYLSENNRKKAIEQYRKAISLDGGVSDRGLESELLRGVRDRTIRAATDMLPPHNGGANNPSLGNGGFDFGDDDDLDDDMPMEPLPEPTTPRFKLDQVGGMEALKERLIQKFRDPLQDPTLHRAYHKKVGGAMLLYGAPGCGKSTIAEAIAGECGAGFLSISVHDVLDQYFGSSERNLHQIFDVARSRTPCVLFLDHFDSYASNRQLLRDRAARTLTNQLLQELDSADNDRVLVIASTSLPWLLDASVMRSGRFGEAFLVAPPEKSDRVAILKLLAKDRPVGKIDFDAIASITEGFTGADLEEVFSRAADAALSEAKNLGKVAPIKAAHLTRAAVSIQPTSNSWLQFAKTKLAKRKDLAGMFRGIA